ncbi:hypothetical protein GCM10022232_68860 [Streptomyces plumbiresistens]|uniref:Uncharacterized protein n=1 Tax=Streptomyces plumbiresistens TaxID=511811 RepID=A0ABP7SSK4_9ACTN
MDGIGYFKRAEEWAEQSRAIGHSEDAIAAATAAQVFATLALAAATADATAFKRALARANGLEVEPARVAKVDPVAFAAAHLEA